MHFESLGQYHDAWSTIVLSAPASFRTFDGAPVPDQAAALEEAFALIRSGFVFVEKKLEDPRLLGVLRELIEMSYEAYVCGDTRRGAHVFQECEGLIWPSRSGRLKYVVEAEMRRFGDLRLFKDVKVSPFPCEGTTADLGPRQKALFEHARREAQGFIDAGEAFKVRHWVMHADGSIHALRARSKKQALIALRQGAASGDLVACAAVHFPFGSVSGLLAVHLEEPGRPRIEVISLVTNGVVDPPHHHLHEPDIFTSTAAGT